jgi:hypothetical protein
VQTLVNSNVFSEQALTVSDIPAQHDVVASETIQ